MGRSRYTAPPPWSLFPITLAIGAPIVAGILLGGPALGFLAAVVVAGVIVTAAVRPRMGGEPAWQVARRFLAPLAVAVAGAVLVIVGSRIVSIIGWGVIAVAATLAISLVFLEVGYSEDRARERGEYGPRRRPEPTTREPRRPAPRRPRGH